MPTYLRPEDLARRWGVSTGTLANRRSRGQGPAFTKIFGTLVRYSLADVERFEAEGHVKAVA